MVTKTFQSIDLAQPAPLTAEDYWTADQLKVMRGLELPAWFRPTAHNTTADLEPTKQALTADKAIADEVALPAQSIGELDPEALVSASTQMTLPTVASATSLQALASQAQQCAACTLGQQPSVCRKQLTLDNAQSSAQWLIVLDDTTQRAELLTDAEHRLLGNMLASVGQSWDTVSLTSLLKCARAGNVSLDAFSPEVEACKAFLRQQLVILKPQGILAMGALSAQALIGVDDDITLLAGEVHEFDGLPLIAMRHPTELLADASLKSQAWRDLNLASAQ